MRLNTLFVTILTLFVSFVVTNAQTTERPRPAEWSNLVYGGRFMDRFLPMPNLGLLTRDTWGADNVLPRYTNNGIENRKWSFWGGNIKLGEDGKYHFYVCGWLESSPKGHNEWPNSIVFHAICDNSFGPFIVKDTIGKGHNPEIFKLKDGRYVLYVINGYYISDGCNGPWTYGKFEFLNRDRRLIEGNSNFTFAQREDGSYLMICRGGGQWFSQTGLSAYNQVTGTRIDADNKIIPLRAYPQRPGRFEDPVVWRDNVQYNLIVMSLNDTSKENTLPSILVFEIGISPFGDFTTPVNFSPSILNTKVIGISLPSGPFIFAIQFPSIPAVKP